SSLTSLAYIGSTKRILAGGNALKVLGVTRSVKRSRRVFSSLFDQPSRPCEQVRRNCHTDLLCCLEVDNKLELRWLLDRQIGGLCSFQDFVHIRSGAAERVVIARAVGHKTPVFHRFWPGVYRREPALYSEVCNLFSVRIEDGAVQREACVSTTLARRSECGLNILRI